MSQASHDVADKHGFLPDGKHKNKRIYRRPKDRPVPSQPGDAEVNRLKKQFKVRADAQLIIQVTQAAKAAGISRQDWIEEAMVEKLESENIRVPES